MSFSKTLAAVAVISMACGGASADGRDTSVAAIKQRGKLVMLTFPSWKNDFASPNLETGPTRRVGGPEHFLGVDVDLASSFAESLGVSLEIRTLEEPGYGVLIEALLEGEGDLIASALSITEERRKIVSFSDPYFSAYRVVIARRGAGIRSLADLVDKVAAVNPGSSHAEYLKRLGVKEHNLYYVDFTTDYYTAVEKGDADFALVDSTHMEDNMAVQRELEIAFRLPGEDQYGIAVPLGSELREYLNRFLADLRSTGELDRILRRHLGTDAESGTDPER